MWGDTFGTRAGRVVSVSLGRAPSGGGYSDLIGLGDIGTIGHTNGNWFGRAVMGGGPAGASFPARITRAPGDGAPA